MVSFLQFLRNLVRGRRNSQPKSLGRADQHTIQYVMIFNHDVYFNHDQSTHRQHIGNVLNHDHSFHSSNNGNWMSNTVTNSLMENASTVITNGNSTGGFDGLADRLANADMDNVGPELVSQSSFPE
ncbi:hypothetical protein D9613_007434 [Agrocybe pediades]|uniref:Uncharacterized protein n=1 Tax=Agrocybe pediades TaxID=84607 RepID=A0A8H4VMY6_9AGAR|nr:hypothetical protein D9613_007434 [Agrocybe pediades]